MTWDIFVFDFRDELPDRRLLFSDKFTPPLMGSVAEIRSHLETPWSNNIIWDDEVYYHDSLCVIKVDIFELDGKVTYLRLRPGYERIGGKMPNPYRAIQNLCMAYGWSAYDQEINCFLEFPSPSRLGLKMVRQRAASFVRRTRDLKRKSR